MSFAYRLKKNELKQLHDQYDDRYESVIDSRGKAAVKNAAAGGIPFESFFEERRAVEDILETALIETLTDMHAEMLSFHLLGITIPEDVVNTQLLGEIQIEDNIRANYEQIAALERAKTGAEVHAIGLDSNKTVRVAEAEAVYIQRVGIATAQQLEQEAFTQGLSSLYNAIGLVNETHKASFDYIRTLTNSAMQELSIGHIKEASAIVNA
jgi:hypothetical protein